MTVIAYRDGVLAGDGRIVMGSTIVSDRTRKVWRLRDGSLFGAAGNAEQCEQLKRAVTKHQPTPVFDDVSAVMVTPEGILSEYEGSTWVKCREPYTAIGSGGDLALLAMDFGATAEQAVKGANKRHTNSGGRTFSVKLK